MKPITSFLALTLIVVLVHGPLCTSAQVSTLQIAAPVLQTSNVYYKSILFNTDPKFKTDRVPNYCREYKTKQTAGFVLFSLGMGSMAGGAYMTYLGVNRVANAVGNNPINLQQQETPALKNDIALTAAGATLAFVGLIITPTGLAMGINGTIKYNRYCRATSRSLMIGPTTKGIGLAYTF